MSNRGRVAVGIVALATLLAACGGSARPPVLGDDDDLEESPGVDAGQVDATADATTFFIAPAVAASDDPTTCAEAAALRSYVGCDYWPTVVANVVWSIFDYAVVVANAGATPATVTITGPKSTNQTQTVAPNALAKFYLPWVPELKGTDTDACGSSVALTASVVAKGGAYHLVSSVPVTVYQFNALEYAASGGPPGKDWSSCPGLQTCTDMTSPNYDTTSGCFSYTNDSSLLIPSTAMTGNYRVAGFPGQSTVDPTMQMPPVPSMGSYFAITATTDGTTVTVQLSSTGTLLAGGVVPATAPGGTITLSMDAGDVIELVGAEGDGVDLSGSLVSADQPVQVIAGAPCDLNPNGAPACDHLEQSVFPAETLGRQYFVTVPSGPYGDPKGHVVRLYGNVDGTILDYKPSKPPGCPSTLNAGQVVTCSVASSDYVTSDFEVIGSSEFAVGSFMLGGSIVDPSGGLGDPSASFVVAAEQFRTKYVFLAPSDYESNFADVVAPVGTTVVLDGRLLNTIGHPIGDGFVVVHGVDLGSAGAHVLTASAPIGLQVMGYGSFTSYQYPGGLNLKIIAPPPTPP
ncbi:MAG: IgGFc-binding protein [Polyangiaceae bacterium]